MLTNIEYKNHGNEKPDGKNQNSITAQKIRESKENGAFSLKMRGFYLLIIPLKTNCI